jgi:xanthine dehydrogenase iron-sulfur cluster and FAD-binding subunit A
MTVVEHSFPALHDMLKVFGSPQIRNLATLGGNLGTASPIGDTLPVLMAYGAKVIVESVHGKRKINMDYYITGYRRTARKEDEIVTAVKIRKPDPGVLVKSYKISKRKDLDISTVSAGFRLERDEQGNVRSIVLAYGGMADRTRRASRTEEFLTGKKWIRKHIEQAMPIVDEEFSPISDARAGAEFRKIAARNLLLKFWHETSAS